MNPILLIETRLESDSLKKKIHIYKIIFFCETRKYRFILPSIFTTEIEWSSHSCEENRDFLCLEFFDNSSDIFFDIFWRLSLKCIIGSDTEYSKLECSRSSTTGRIIRIKNPIDTREEPSTRITRDSCILHEIIISIFFEFFLEL